jgi:hypothetical protein
MDVIVVIGLSLDDYVEDSSAKALDLGPTLAHSGQVAEPIHPCQSWALSPAIAPWILASRGILRLVAPWYKSHKSEVRSKPIHQDFLVLF